jgi:hypothetical protein
MEGGRDVADRGGEGRVAGAVAQGAGIEDAETRAGQHGDAGRIGGTALAFQTDTKGQFDVRLPDSLKGTVVIFDPAQTGPVGGASLELP